MDDKHTAQNALIDGCLRGEPSCQQRLFERHYGKMLAVCMRYSSDQDMAKDIVQDGFIKVFDNLGKFNRQGSLEGWIRRIIVNTAIDMIRKQKRDLLLSRSEDLLDEGADWEEDSTEEEPEFLQMDDVIAAMQKLSPAYRAVFNLYVMEEKTHKEIAAALGISEGTSKSNLAKARRNLKKHLIESGVIKQ